MPRLSLDEFSKIFRECLSECGVNDLTKKATIALVLPAIVKVESDFDPFAGRYERSYYWTTDPSARPVNCSIATEMFWQKCSWGLTQIMGAVARENGFRGWLSELVDPKKNLAISIKHFVRLGDRFKWNQRDIISSWNQGSPRKKDDGTYKNQHYVDAVLEAMRSKEYLK